MNLTPLLGQSDSLKLVAIPKWKVDKLLHSHFYKLPVSDSLVKSLTKEIDLLYLTLEQSKKLTSITEAQRDNKALQAEIWEQRFNNIVAYHKSELKTEKKKRLKITLIAIGEAVLIVLILL